MTFDASAIQGYAVKAVTGFVAGGVPLSQGIAKIASENELNPEQIKRVVETSNTLAHLKLLESNTDRTFEFPVAKYESVLGHMVSPGQTDDVSTKEQDPIGRSQEESENIKYASADLQNHLHRGAVRVRAEIEKIAYEKQIILNKIETSIKKIASAEFPLEKLAEVSTEDEFNVISGYFEKSASATAKLVFEDKELNEARNLVGLVKQAKALIKEEHEKAAFLAAAGKVIGGIVGAPVRYTASKITDAVGGLGTEAASLRNTGHVTPEFSKGLKTLGTVAGHTLNFGLTAATMDPTHNPLARL